MFACGHAKSKTMFWNLLDCGIPLGVGLRQVDDGAAEQEVPGHAVQRSEYMITLLKKIIPNFTEGKIHLILTK